MWSTEEGNESLCSAEVGKRLNLFDKLSKGSVEQNQLLVAPVFRKKVMLSFQQAVKAHMFV